MSEQHEYTDRFGYTWSIQLQRRRGKPKELVFMCGELKLVAATDEGPHPRDLTDTQIKDIFCDAERVMVDGDETWFVGYRTRTGGRNGRVQAGMCTRFRAASGEVRYAKGMLHFRQMAEEELSKHLASAQVARR